MATTQWSMARDKEVLNEEEDLERYPLHLACDSSPFLEVVQLLLEKSTNNPWNKISQQNVRSIVPVIVAIPPMPYWNWCLSVQMKYFLPAKEATHLPTIVDCGYPQNLPHETITNLLTKSNSIQLIILCTASMVQGGRHGEETINNLLLETDEGEETLWETLKKPMIIQNDVNLSSTEPLPVSAE